MGVPSFYRWLVNKYPKVVEDTMQNSHGWEFDNLYIDMNAIIHPCFHPDADDHNIPVPITFEDVFRNVFDYIDRLVDIVRPRKLLFMAIDGVAPRAKMNQQRARRFQTAKDKKIREAEEERLRKQFETEGKQVLPKQESEVSDSNVITPGTEFMHELSKALKRYISSRIISDSLWKDIIVILSDANVPGEGEHKIMSYIRSQRCQYQYNPNTRHCLYGSDADLIMLAMATHEPHFSILREDVPIQHQQQKIAKPFKFLHIWLLREYLELDLNIEDLPKNFTSDFERIVDDFIFMCFFAGNDFLPHMPSLEIHEGAIDLLMSVYKKEFNKLGGYLLDMTRIGEKNAAFMKLSRVEKFIFMVGTYEEKIFKKRSEIRERKLRRLISDYEDAKLEEKDAACPSDHDNENSSDCALHIKKATASKTISVTATPAEILQNTKDLKDEVNKCMREKYDLFKSGEFLIDKIKLGIAGYKERYYKAKFSVEGPSDIECRRKEVVQKYTEGLLWVLRYYFTGVASWTWFYPFHYAPFASDLKGMSQVRAKFEKGVPFLPLDQLLSVIPPSSAHALPKAYAQLMLDEQSRIIDLYPQEFEVDTEGRRFMWQGICKLPWIDEGRLLAETKGLSKDELSVKIYSENEAVRNAVKVDSLFVGSSNKLAGKIYSFLETNTLYELDTRISDGIGGTISLSHECVEKGMEIYGNKKEDRVLCVNYEQLACSNHIPRLLSGVNLPETTIDEVDIMETELWHERQNYNSFGRVQNKDKRGNKGTEIGTTSNFSSNVPPEVAYKGVGVGWGSGRGKASSSSNMKSIDPLLNERAPHLPPFRKRHDNAGTCYVTTTRDTRSQNFVDSFRQITISESNHLPRPDDRPYFGPFNNGYTNQSRNAHHHHQGPHSQAMAFGRGRGRIQHGSHSVNSLRSVSSSTNGSLQSQWSGAKSYQVKDQNHG